MFKCTNVWAVVVCLSSCHIESVIRAANARHWRRIFELKQLGMYQNRVCPDVFFLKLAFITPPSGGFTTTLRIVAAMVDDAQRFSLE